jgi:hypothetical protein
VFVLWEKYIIYDIVVSLLRGTLMLRNLFLKIKNGFMKTGRLLLLIFIMTGTSILLEAQTKKGIIEGTVVDHITKEPIIGASISVLNTSLGNQTNLRGEYKVAGLEPGNYSIKISYIGYATVVKSDIIVNSARPTNVYVELMETAVEIGGVTVTSDYFQKDPSETGSTSSFSYEEIRRAPGGFEDVIRALSVIPGVGQASPGRNDLVVRGGAPSENLSIVDGFVVPNINHFGSQGATGGPLSFINLDYVRGTTFSTGGFPVLYGDKLSSVLKIDLQEGRKNQIGGKGTISATQFGFNIDGPVGENFDFLFSARRSYLDFIFNAAGFNFVPEYYDLLTKLTYRLDSKNTLSYLFVGAFDDVKFNNNDAEDRYKNSRILGSAQNQYVTGISFRHLYDRGFVTFALSRNFIDYDASQKDSLLNPVFKNKSREQENEIKIDLVYKPGDFSELDLGTSVKLIKFNTDIKLDAFKSSFGETLNITSLTAVDNYEKYSFFAQFSDFLFGRIMISAGLRGDYFSGINNGFSVSPRGTLTYMFTDKTNITLSGGLFTQSPSYIWLAASEANKELKPVKVIQSILGLEHKISDDMLVKVEGFYKKYSDYPASVLRKYLVLANTGGGYAGPEDNYSSFGLEPLVSEGKGNVKGVEFSIQKKSSSVPFYGIVSITYSKAAFTGLDGIERPGTYDQRWIINLSGGYIFNNKWEAAFKFRFATGAPCTPFNNDGTQTIANYNTQRLPSSHSLDLRVDRRWDFDGWNLIAYLDIQNIYNKKNSYALKWNYRENKVENQSAIGILPSIGFSIEF